MKRFICIVIVAALLAPLHVFAAVYTIDPVHSTIGFKVKHLMVTNVNGVFEKFKGSVNIDDKDISKSKVDVSIEMASINTNITKRDDHLRSPDFFDVAKFPSMTFVSTKVEKIAADKLRVTGNLTVKGVTRQVILNVEGPSGEIKSPQGDIKRGASATTTINRQDFGVSWSKNLDGGGLVVADEVHISIDIELARQ